MRFDERENLLLVLLAMKQLELQDTPQTIRAIHAVLGGTVSEPTIRDWRRWAVYNYAIVTPPKGFQDPETWDGHDDLIFSVDLDRLPSELLNTRASTRVLRKQFDQAAATGVFSYDLDGNLAFKPAEYLEQIDTVVGADKYLDAVTRYARSIAPDDQKNVVIDRDKFIELMQDVRIDTDYEQHRHPLRAFAAEQPETTSIKPSTPGFVSRFRAKIHHLLKIVANL